MNDDRLKDILCEIEDAIDDQISTIQAKISPGAPQSFNDDMNGCIRGLSMAKSIVVRLISKRFDIRSWSWITEKFI